MEEHSIMRIQLFSTTARSRFGICSSVKLSKRLKNLVSAVFILIMGRHGLKSLSLIEINYTGWTQIRLVPTATGRYSKVHVFCRMKIVVIGDLKAGFIFPILFS
jgi:hypothetical protein